MNDRELLQAAEKHAAIYDGDTREVIAVDVQNAFFAGARWRKSQPEWVRVSDALPVVPKGAATINLWLWHKLHPHHSPSLVPFRGGNWEYFGTHWRYAEPTPLPPETTT